jgi:outer membrane lipopolysaccharide assembly protein LptE/RlpB
MRFLTVLLLLTLLGCGYHFPDQRTLPGGVRTLHIPLYQNRTAEPQIESLLTNDASLVLARNPQIIQLEDPTQAEAILQGVISSYKTAVVSYDSQDDISEYRVSLTLDVSLRAVTDGRLLWQGQMAWHEEYAADDDKNRQEDLERAAVEEISLRLAEELSSRLQADF